MTLFMKLQNKLASFLHKDWCGTSFDYDVYWNRLSRVEEKLKHGRANANGIYQADTLPPLAIAVMRNHVEMVRLLLEHRAFPNTRIWFVPVLQYAVGNQRHEVVELLLDAGADPFFQSIVHQSAVSLVRESGNREMEDLFIQTLLKMKGRKHG